MSAGGPPDLPPVAGLFADVVGQASAVAALRAAARAPVHAYLLVGPRGSTRHAAARGFAAALLCPDGGCGHCRHCRLALAGKHPDLVVVERTGATVGIDEARRLVGLAQRRPFEATRQVIVVADVHLAARSAPALLKTIEEPPPPTFFVLLADDVPPELVTVASRCVEVAFTAVAPREIERWLVDHGKDPELAIQVARWSGGDVERARLLAEDPGAASRAALWRSLPERLDGNGATAADVAREVQAAIDGAVAALRERHAAELQQLTEEAEQWGERGLPGRKEIVDRHHREERQWRTEELEAGLAALARTYRDAMTSALGVGRGAGIPQRPAEAPAGGRAGVAAAGSAADAAAIVSQAAEALTWNPNELLWLEALFLELSAL